MATRLLRTVYNLVFQRRLYYHLRSQDRITCNFSMQHGVFLGFSPKLSFREICSGFTYALYVGTLDPSAAMQVDKWFTCGFFRKDEVLILVYSRSASARKKFIRFFMTKGYNFAVLPDFSQRALHPIRAVFYPFNSLTNPYLINLRDAKHIHIGHGESDKSGSANMMFRMYDHILASGEIAIGRLEKAQIVSAQEVTQGKVLRIGMPFVCEGQVNTKGRKWNVPTVGKPMSVLYAPTWEGAGTRQYYSSLQRNVGLHYLESLIEQGMTSTVAFRPHPSTGVGAPLYIERCIDIIELLSRTHQTEVQVLGDEESHIFAVLGHRKNRQRLMSCRLLERPLELEAYDVVVTDVSSIITACIAYGVPYVVLHLRQDGVSCESPEGLYDQFPLCRGGINYLEGDGYLEDIGPGHEHLYEIASHNLHAIQKLAISYDEGLEGCTTNRELFERVCTKLALHGDASQISGLAL